MSKNIWCWGNHTQGVKDCWTAEGVNCRLAENISSTRSKQSYTGFVFFFFLDSSTWQVKVREGKNSVLIGRKPKPAGKDYMTKSGSKRETVSCCGGIWTAPAGWHSCQGLMAAASSCGASKDEGFLKAVNHEGTAVRWEHKVDVRPRWNVLGDGSPKVLC